MGQLLADFTLLEDLRWSDGESLAASDAVFSYKIAQQCETNLRWCVNHSLVERTADFIALDETSARWIGLPGFMDPKYMTNFFQPMPEHQLRDMPVSEMAEADETALQPMGWGPYMIDNKWDIDREIRLKKNPYYFRAGEGLPRFDQLVFRFTGQNSMMNISEILAGECDLVDQNAALDDVRNLLLGMDRQGLLQAHVVNGTVWEHFDFSLLHADYDDGYQIGSDRPDLFGDVRTRQAIAMCLDRERVINEAVFELSEFELPYLDPGHPLYDTVFGVGEAPNTYIPTDHPLYNPEIPVYQYSTGKAIALLEDVGWIDHDGDRSTPRQAHSVPNVPDGTLLEFHYWTTTANQRKRVAPILAESMAKCGIQANIQHWQPADFFELPESPVFSRNFDVVEFAWLTDEFPPCDIFLSENIPGDPDVRNPDGSQRFQKGWEGSNNSGYRSPEFDQACKAALAALPGQPGFIENHLSAQEIFSRDLPVVPLFQRIKVTAARADMCGYWMDSTANSDTWNIEEFGYGDECGE
jgi:peptide/nickel transport system substrate-binding protein